MASRLAAVFLALALSAQQTYRPGLQVVTYFSEVDHTDQPYGLYVPKNYDPARRYPLVVSLHGENSNHRLNLRRVFGRGNLPGETDAEATRYFPQVRDVDFIVVTPLARGTMGYQGVAERDVYDAIDDVKKRFLIDDDRVYLTGLSMGGGGALWLGLTRPDLWAAIAAVCPVAPDGLEERAGNALDIPVQLYQGQYDPVVPPVSTRAWHRRFFELDVRADYVEFPHVRHNAWDFAYRNGAVFDWFAKYRRNRFPDRVRFTTREYKYSRAYWVRIDLLTPGEPASIDARFTAHNAIEVQAAGVDAFTLLPAGHAMYEPSRPATVMVDGVPLRVAARAALSFERSPKGWRPGRATPTGGAKRAGAEGPIADALSGRHVYVWGTAGAEDDIERRRAEAERAAEWSSARHPLLLTFRAVADSDADPAADLFLLGTRETNSLIAKYDAVLPLRLNAGAADYGLLFVAPAGGRYAVVNSGLPFWTGAEDVKRGGQAFLPPTWRLLQSFGDYILFKGSLSNVIAGGRFDRNWKLPPGDAAKIRATGAVTVHP